MTTVTFILGLCGSGKTWLADRIVADVKFDEGFLDNKDQQHDALIKALHAGQDCVVVEIQYCREDDRKKIVEKIRNIVPNVYINWLCIENDLHRANKNCYERTNKGDPTKHVNINRQLSSVYKYPEGSVVVRMWTKES